MKFRKILACLLLTYSFSGVVRAAPRNIIEMTKQGKPDEGDPETDAKLSVDELKPPDHLDAVKLEQDGMINKDYKKEIFLGNHEEIENDANDVGEAKLKDIIVKVDVDGNGKICADEIESWIMEKTKEHFDEALRENEHVFHHMDPDGDGLVDWKEYYVHFLLAKGYPLEQAQNHVVDYDDIQMTAEEREQLIRYKFKWTDADIDPTDNKLSKSEFLSFRHPEQSEQALQHMVKTILKSLDKNEDNMLSKEEFVEIPSEIMGNGEDGNMNNDWKKEREEEFKNLIDFNHDGIVSLDELIRYIDPRNPDNAKSDVKVLLGEMDDDHDGCLSWEEVLMHKDQFIQSKMVNVRRILHDEF